MYLATIPLESAQGVQTEERRLNICKIILMEMERKNIRSRSLAPVRRLAHKTIKKRLQTGDVSADEQRILIELLELDEERIYFTITYLSEPEQYFTEHCTFMKRMTEVINGVLGETLPALGGNFMPIKDNLYEIIAQKVEVMIVDQHRRNLANFCREDPSIE